LLLIVLCFLAVSTIPRVKSILTQALIAGKAGDPSLPAPQLISEAKRASWAQAQNGFTFLLNGFKATNDGGGGAFYVDRNDRRSPENHGTVFVAEDGTRLKRLWSGEINVRWFGAVGNGRDDDSEAISSAWAFCTAQPSPAAGSAGNSLVLYFPSGNYNFSHAPLTFSSGIKTFRLKGDGYSQSRISIKGGNYFISLSDLSACDVSGLQFSGGSGFLKINNQGTNVRGTYFIHDCSFTDYTECAVGHLSSDMPAWRIENNIFFGSAEWSSTGVALSGLTDNSIIQSNQFQRNRYGIKIHGGYNAYIKNNDFIRYTKPLKDATDIWIVPASGPANQGLVIAENKFGNENLQPTDFRILIAAEDEAAGGDFVTRRHSTADQGDRLRLGLLAIRDNNFVGAAGYRRGIIASYCSDIRYVDSKNMFSGAYPKAMIEFMGNFSQSRLNMSSVHDLTQFYDATESLAPPLSENPVGLSRDPWGYGTGGDSFVQYFPSGQDPSYVPLLNPADSLYKTLVGTAEKIEVPDDKSAVELHWRSARDYLQMPFRVKVAHKPVWVEFDLKQAADKPLESAVLDIRPKDKSNSVFRRVIRVPGEWQRVRFIWFPPDDGEYRVLFPENLEPFQEGRSERLMIANLHLYQAHEPVANGLLRGTALALQPSPVPNGETGKTMIYIDPADESLKLRSKDGTIRTIVTKP
jgi:parallel beta-helix repeat protein